MRKISNLATFTEACLEESTLSTIKGGKKCKHTRVPCGPVVTTAALGEEDGGGGVTTQAIGEEDGGGVTTQAIGEER